MITTVVDSLLPASIVHGPAETYRRSRLVVYAVLFTIATAIPVAFVVEFAGGSRDSMMILLGILPAAITLVILHITRSTAIAGHYLTAIVFIQVIGDYSRDNGYSILAVFALPIIACAVISERAGMFWTLVGASWIAWIGVQTDPSDSLFFGVVWSAAIVTLVVGFALILLETTRTNARVEMERVTQALASQQQRLMAFANNAFPGIAQTEKGNILYSSEGVESILGYTPEQFKMRDLTEYLHPEEIGEIVTRMTNYPTEGFRREVRLRHADGHWKWLEAFAIPFGPSPDGWIFAARDIDDERAQRERWIQAERLESVGLLSAGIAHDFNNLLMVIMGFAETLDGSEAQREIVKASTQAAALTQQLLSFSRPQHNDERFVDVTQALKDILPMLKSLMGAETEVSLTLDLESVSAAINPGHLHQILVNLCTNARDAMPQGGHVRITASQKDLDQNNTLGLADGQYVSILVTDDGAGMDDYARQHAFDPFFSTKVGTRSSGLGLASVYGLVQAAGGTLDLTSAAGEGTSIDIVLPVVQDPPPLHAVRLDKHAAPIKGNTKTILVVEDDTPVRALLSRTLRDAGFNVESSSNAIDAIEIAKVLEPDLLITDVAMPGIRGPALAERLRERFPNLRVLLISGNTQTDVPSWEATDETRFLAKPFRSGDLLSLLQNWWSPST